MTRALRICSFKHLLLSVVLGFLFLASYILVLFLIDQAGKTPPTFMLNVIGWPRWLWILLGGRFSDEDLLPGLTFFAVCNTALYALIIYPLLLGLAAVRHKQTVVPPPPLPDTLELRTTNSD